ncbi:MAG: ABC-2 family transporter protein [Bacillota bacterium]|jgi:ABC-2 type transport system permease protein
MRKYLITMRLSASRAFDGGLLYILSGYLLKSASLIILLLLWRALAQQGADLGGFTLEQLLTYTLLASVLSEQLNVITPATTAFWEGAIISRYMRPLPVLAQMMAETAGSWLPGLLLYSIPTVIIASIAGLNPGGALLSNTGFTFLALTHTGPLAALVNGLLFLISLLLAISLGFAMDFIFASLVIYVKNASYQAYQIRRAIVALFSGALIPFALLPWGMGRIFEMLPFGSTASAPLLVFIGAGGNPIRLILLQLFWNLVFWAAALILFRRSEERLVSYGG